MKRIVSVSLGSSARNSSQEIVLGGQTFRVSRIGTDGSLPLLIDTVRRLDGAADAITIGGIDFHLSLLKKKYPFRDARRIAAAAAKTPLCDGDLFRRWGEPLFIRRLHHRGVIHSGQTVLFPLAANRLPLAAELERLGYRHIRYGDLVYDIGFPPVTLRSLKTYDRIGRLVAPLLVNLPFAWLYPTGSKQEEHREKRPDLFRWADIITGDFHNISRYCIDDLSGKTIITNTITGHDRQRMKARKLPVLVTFSPNIGGRCFGANVLDGIMVTLIGRKPEEIDCREYTAMLETLGLEPNVERLDAPSDGIPEGT